MTMSNVRTSFILQYIDQLLMIEWCCSMFNVRFSTFAARILVSQSRSLSPSTTTSLFSRSQLFNWIYNQSSRLMTIFRDLKFQFQILPRFAFVRLSPMLFYMMSRVIAVECRASTLFNSSWFYEVNAQATNYLLDWTTFRLICDSYSHSRCICKMKNSTWTRFLLILNDEPLSNILKNLHKLHKWHSMRSAYSRRKKLPYIN